MRWHVKVYIIEASHPDYWNSIIGKLPDALNDKRDEEVKNAALHQNFAFCKPGEEPEEIQFRSAASNSVLWQDTFSLPRTVTLNRRSGHGNWAGGPSTTSSCHARLLRTLRGLLRLTSAKPTKMAPVRALSHPFTLSECGAPSQRWRPQPRPDPHPPKVLIRQKLAESRMCQGIRSYSSSSMKARRPKTILAHRDKKFRSRYSTRDLPGKDKGGLRGEFVQAVIGDT